jgi:hypothetical protein
MKWLPVLSIRERLRRMRNELGFCRVIKGQKCPHQCTWRAKGSATDDCGRRTGVNQDGPG